MLGTSKQVFLSGSVQDMKRLVICRGMPSMCDDLVWLSEHASLTRANSAPTQALDEADDAGLTPAHSRPVHSGEGGYGIQGCLNQDKCLLVKSINVHVLCVSWLCPAGHSFHGAQSQQRVCFKKWE